MRSIELADRVEETIREARSRIVGVGQDQYSLEGDEVQRFERRSLAELITELRAEVIDQINWAVMMDVMLQRRLEQLAELGEDE